MLNCCLLNAAAEASTKLSCMLQGLRWQACMSAGGTFTASRTPAANSQIN